MFGVVAVWLSGAVFLLAIIVAIAWSRHVAKEVARGAAIEFRQQEAEREAQHQAKMAVIHDAIRNAETPDEIEAAGSLSRHLIFGQSDLER